MEGRDGVRLYDPVEFYDLKDPRKKKVQPGQGKHRATRDQGIVIFTK